MSVAGDKLNAPRSAHTARMPRSLLSWRPRRGVLAHGAEVVAWVAFYVIVRALVG